MSWIEKYTAQTFTDLVGLNDILMQIEGFILSGDIPHLLFYGKAGTGKTTTAHIVGHKILGEYFVGNFRELNGSDEREEKDVKEIVKSLRNMPLSFNLRVILWDEFNLKPTAQDLLKRPMEKFRNTIHIITTNDFNSVIEPIRSRCKCFEFKPLSDNAIIEGLKRIMVKESLSIDDSIFGEIARKSKGDMRTAINELQGVSALNNRNSEIDKIVQQYMKKEGAVA